MNAESPSNLTVGDSAMRGMGRTPPPGSKRAAELRSDEGLLPSAYKPPALRSSPLGPVSSSLDEASLDDSTSNSGSSGSKYDSGYRRARAGTLPTDLGGHSSRYLPPAVRSGNSTPNEAFVSGSHVPSNRPNLRHAASSAASLTAEANSTANRIRSGSLTLPANEIGNAFGSAFSSAWLANPGLSSGGAKSGLSNVASNTSSHAEEMRDASHDSTPGDELGNFSTLDYLGLEAVETPKQASFFPPASMSELRMQAQQAIANNGPSSRHRASTVSTMARPAYKSSGSYSDLIAAATDERGRLHGSGLDAFGGYDYHDDSSEYPAPYGVPKGFKDEVLLNALSSRPRATTIGISDGQRRSGARGSAAFQAGLGGGQQYPDRRADKDFAGMHRAIAPRHNLTSSISSRTSTPDAGARDSGAGAGQVPTRSLWLGNLDVTTTAQELMAFFAPYGAIESLRLLPEKSCAFVNFIDKADAIQAKDDVLIRLGGHITELSDTPVRVGYGKIDSVPTAAPTASTMQYSLSNSSLSSLASGQSENGDAGSPEQRMTSQNSPDITAQPTRALWIGSIPATTTPGTLLSIFSPFGPVESARVLTNKQCGFVNFENISSAVAARTALNGREILGSEVGAVKICFARIPVKSAPVDEVGNPGGSVVAEYGDLTSANTGSNVRSALKERQGFAGVSADAAQSGMENFSSNLVLDLLQKGVHDDVRGLRRSGSVSGASDAASSAHGSEAGITEQQMIMMVFSQGDPAMAEDVLAISEPDKPALYYSYIPAMTERSAGRRFDAVALKEIRKRLDTGACDQQEVDQIATDLLEDCVDLSSDYIGNCLIQRLFERANPAIRMAMLERIAPHLALIGTHKNGTWAAQKIIECAQTPQELATIAQNLQPYCPPLCADQYGNYVVSICLRFGEPSNHFIFNAMVDRVWDIAQTRFGARCMRTCLESHFTSPFQRKRIATAIVLHSIPLATNPNGALLLTWLVDASELPGRYSLLAPRFAPYLAHLATHKLASLTVLRIVNQKAEPEAATTILDAMFKSPNDQVLHEILQDQVHGCHTVAKIICGGVISPENKPEMVAATKRVLMSMRVASSFAYRKLLEECGLPVSSAPSGPANNRYANGRSPPNPGPGPGTRGGYSTGTSTYPSGMGRGGQSPYRPAQQYSQGNSNYSVGPSAQELAMSSMMNSMQAFQLGQGMAQQGSLSPIVIPQQSFSQIMHPSPQVPPMSPTPTLGSYATPHASMMSPNSDPFNPFSSPSQLPRSSPMNFGTQVRDDAPPFQINPSFGGLGMQAAEGGQGGGYRYQPFMHPQHAMYGQAAATHKSDTGYQA